jgi:hypothetical protein
MSQSRCVEKLPSSGRWIKLYTGILTGMKLRGRDLTSQATEIRKWEYGLAFTVEILCRGFS